MATDFIETYENARELLLIEELLAQPSHLWKLARVGIKHLESRETACLGAVLQLRREEAHRLFHAPLHRVVENVL